MPAHREVVASAAITPGDDLPPLKVEPTHVQLFRFSAVTWNSHRIHYDADHARSECYTDIVVHSHLHAAYLYECLATWLARFEPARIARFGWRNKAVALVGQPLICSGRVESVTELADARHVDVTIEDRDEGGTVCASGWATVTFEISASGSRPPSPPTQTTAGGNR